jgi:hypothetical protein
MTRSDRRWVTSTLDAVQREMGVDSKYLQSILPEGPEEISASSLAKLRYFEGNAAYGRWLAASLIDRYWKQVADGTGYATR